MKNTILILLSLILNISCGEQKQRELISDPEEMMVRIAEIEIYPKYLDEYVNILKEESRASLELEHGVISIYPMNDMEQPNRIKILEIYRSKKAYEAHLQTPHFKKYKSSTQEMVKSLKLIDMNMIDGKTMPMIFRKID